MKKSLAFALAAFILVAIATLALYMDGRARTVADTERVLAARAQQVAASVDRVLEWRTIEMLTLVALPSLRGYAASDEVARPSRTAIALAELQAIVAADPNIRSASIVNQAGYVILATDASMNSDWSKRVFVQEALAGHLHASVPVREFGEVSQYFSGPLLDNAADVAGALIIRVSVQEMWDPLTDQPNVWIVDGNGVRIADSSDKPQLFTALTPLSGDSLLDILAEERYGEEVEQIRSTNLKELGQAIRKKEKQLTFTDPNGRAIRAAIRPLENNPWTVIAFEEEKGPFAIVFSVADLLKVGAVAALLGAGLAYAYMRWSVSVERKA